MISHFLFRNETEQSLAELADLYNLPKSTFHHKVDSFKKKIASSYTPENEYDGIFLIQNISKALDKLSN
jgi:DNA-binding IclR family transcriptional regulator